VALQWCSSKQFQIQTVNSLWLQMASVWHINFVLRWGRLSETPSEMEVERRKVVDALEAEVVAWRSGIGYWASQHHAVLCPCIHLSPLFCAAFGGAPFACFNGKGLPLDWAKSAQLGSGFGGFSYFDLEPPYWSAWTAEEWRILLRVASQTGAGFRW
jgi:hypothetical protein